MNTLANPFEACWFHPDTLIPWEIIESVVVPINHENTMICPICLDLVHIPKMTKCGHSYCYLCIIRHMKSDRSNRLKCPMCLEYIFLQDLKSVKYENRLLSSDYVKEEEYNQSHRKNPNFVKYSQNDPRRRGSHQQRKLKNNNNNNEKEKEPDSKERDLEPEADPSSETVEPDHPVGIITKEEVPIVEEDPANNNNTVKRFIKFRHIFVMKGNISPQMTTSSSTSTNKPVGSNKDALAEQLSLLQNAIPAEDSLIASYSRVMFRSIPGMIAMYERENTDLLVLQKENEQTLLYVPRPLTKKDEENDEKFFSFFETKKNLQYTAIAFENLLKHQMSFEQSLMSKFYVDLSETSQLPMKTLSTAVDSSETSSDNLVFNSNNELISHFYQVNNGSLSFLHPLCLRCLIDYYSSLATIDPAQQQTVSSEEKPISFPEFLIGKVVEIEKIRLTNALKQKYSFLRYLPQYAEIEFIEIELKPLVSKSVYSKFASEIMKRHSKRKEKQKLENLEMMLSEEKK
jgi:hypothetical protein